MDCKCGILVGAEEEKVRSSSKKGLLRLRECFRLDGACKKFCVCKLRVVGCESHVLLHDFLG